MKSQPVDFQMQCNAGRAYLVVGSESDGVPTVFPMVESLTGDWNVSVDLPPGMYRYRYYVGNGDVLTYHPPADMAGRELRLGMDAFFRVNQLAKSTNGIG